MSDKHSGGVSLDGTTSSSIPFIHAVWPAPPSVKTLVTTRVGGCSENAYASLNMALHVNDADPKVLSNRESVNRQIDTEHKPYWLRQLHTNVCVEYKDGEEPGPADACFTRQVGRPCVVMTADCLPLLLTDRKGAWVAACHAGWRGLASGVIQNTINAYPGDSSELIAWMGPAISQRFFEVGSEVRSIFLDLSERYEIYFLPNDRARYQFDLFGLAGAILQEYGIERYGGQLCTFDDQERFYSYRRDGETGRMASFIWLENDDL